MLEVRVRLPLGAVISVWESLEIRLVRDQEIVGSNPTTLTFIAVELVLVQAGGC